MKRLTLAMVFALLGHAQVPAAMITNDVFRKDTTGNPIYAQGGGVFKFGGRYYWYGVKYNGAVTYYNNPAAGENSDVSFNAFTCYSSTNLVDWKFENNVMTSSSPGLGGSGWVGRMGVAYNTNTLKYVLVSQFSGSNGSGILFATCDTPTGTFVYDHIQTSVPIVNTTTGDQTVFLDDDGSAYLICSSANGRSHLYVLPFRSSDYLNIEAGDNIYNGNGREGNMMLKHDGRYYFCSSDLHGWNASHCYVIDSANLLGTYSSEYIMNRTDLDFCHVTQTGFGVTVTGTNGSTTLFVGDRWCDFAGNGIGFNQWCPVSFNGSTPTFESVTAFDLDAAAGTWSVASGNNYILNPGYEADRVSQTDVAGWTSTGTGYGNASSSHNPGNWHFHHVNSGAYTATTDQLVTGLPAGTYSLSVWYKSSGGQATARIFARDFGGAELSANVNTVQSAWTQVVIPNIAVTNGQCDVGLYSVANANQSLDVDDWSLTIIAPPPPAGLTAASGNGQVPLNWNASFGATGYNVKRSTSSGGPYTTIASPASNSFTDNTVLNGTTYFYVVSSTNALGESPDSGQVSAVPSAGPIILAASASPNPAYPEQAVFISSTVTAQANPIGAITMDISPIEGSTNQPLFSDGAGHYTNTVTIGATTSVGVAALTVHGSDTLGNVSAPYSFSLTIGSPVETWTGGADDSDWSSGANWDANAAPGFGFSLIFAGLNRLTPVMENSYNIHALTFDNTAGVFNLSGTGSTLILTAGLTNNSANPQTINVPLILGAPVTINAANADVTFSQTISNNGNPLAILDGGHNITVNGGVSGAGGLTIIGPGTNILSGVNTFTGGITISNGTLTLAAAGQLGGGFYAGDISNEGRLNCSSTAAQTLAGSISGSGALNKLGAGPLTLSGANTFSGQTLLAGGTLVVATQLALQNSTVTLGGGTLTFNGVTAASFGGLSGTQNLSLLNNAAAAVALTVGGNNFDTSYSGSLSGASASLTKVGNGTLTLTGNNAYGGATTVSGGTLELSAGGAINCGALNGAGFLVDGGSLTSSGTTSFSAANNALLQTSGSASLGDLTEPNSDGLLIKITGGTFSASSLTLRRTAIFTTAPTATSPISASTTSGLYVNGATADVRLGALTIGTGNSSDTVRVDAGSVVVTNKVLIGRTTNTRWEILQVNGNFTALDAVDGIVLSQNSGTTANQSEFYLSGGTTTAEKIAFGVASDTVGGTGFLIIGGGNLYVGTGGIVRPNTTGYSSTISLLSGTLGAKAEWSSALPMQLSGTSFTLKAADGSNLAHDISLSGVLSGGGGLIKSGAGVLTLNATNSYSGTTTVSAGKLFVNGRLTGTGAVTVASSGLLGGTGTIRGAAIIQGGATLSPGAAGIGTLTFSNSLAFAASATSIFKISKAPLTNDIVKVIGSLTNGGTLTVTNIAVSTPASGDTFKLLDAASYSGAFANVILPTLPAGLAWDTHSLNTNGLISVVVAAPASPPLISGVKLIGGNFVLSGTNGATDATYYLLTSTNLTLPLTNWSRVATNPVSANAPFAFTNSVPPDSLQGFYLLEVQ